MIDVLKAIKNKDRRKIMTVLVDAKKTLRWSEIGIKVYGPTNFHKYDNGNLKNHVNKLIQAGIIEKSTTDYCKKGYRMTLHGSIIHGKLMTFLNEI